MSKMLEQAIVDAEALKEAALKNAQTAIVEKYSQEVKEAVEKILEQPDLTADLAGGFEPPVGATPVVEPTAAPTDGFGSDLPRADTDGDDLCACPEKGKEIEIDFEELAQQLDDDALDHDDILAKAGEEVAAEEEEGDGIKIQLTEDEEISIDEENLRDIIEKLTLDVKNVPTGRTGGSNVTIDNEKAEIALARQAVDETEEEEEELEEDETKELKEQIKKLKNKNKKVLNENKKFKDLLIKLKNKLEEINVSNAKLFYTNNVLGSTSLNERQKNKIVEALSKTVSVEEAKLIFDTLQSAMGEKRVKKSPKSLSEAVTRPSTYIPHHEEKLDSDPASKRWQKLAGIKK